MKKSFSYLWEKNIKHSTKIFVSCLYAKNLQCWKNYALCIFSKVIKNCKLLKTRKRHIDCFSKTHNVTLFVFNHFWKNTKGIVFSRMFIMAYKPPSATHRDQKWHLTIFFVWQNLLFRQNNYIYLFKKCHNFWDMTYRVTFPKKVPF